MGDRTLFLAWQDKGVGRQWFPIGRLDVDVESEKYRFRYIHGAKRAEKEAGFPLAGILPWTGARLQVSKTIFSVQQPGHVAEPPGL